MPMFAHRRRCAPSRGVWGSLEPLNHCSVSFAAQIRQAVVAGSVILLAASGCSRPSVLAGKVVCLDPGHGGTAASDTYRVGPTGEREEWINLRVALALRQLLEARGAKVLMTRTDDRDVPLVDRARLAMEGQADVFISLHHNATADTGVNFPVVYFHGSASENQASVLLGRHLICALAHQLHRPHTPVSLVSDHTIFPVTGTAVLRHSYGIPAVIVEASFFTNPSEEQRLRDPEYNQREAQAYLEGLEHFFSDVRLPVLLKRTKVEVDTFRVLQEAERMSPVARLWRQDFLAAQRLAVQAATDSLRLAYELFTRSARSFPDSYLARECHLQRARLLRLWHRVQEAEMAERRAREHYVDVACGRS